VKTENSIPHQDLDARVFLKESFFEIVTSSPKAISMTLFWQAKQLISAQEALVLPECRFEKPDAIPGNPPIL
jgi:hypothetical protein